MLNRLRRISRRIGGWVTAGKSARNAAGKTMNSGTKAAGKSAGKTAGKPAVKTPAKAAGKSASKAPAKSSAKAVAKPPLKSAPKAGGKPTLKSTAKPNGKAEAKAAPKAVASAAKSVKTAAKPAEKVSDKASPKASPKSVAKPQGKGKSASNGKHSSKKEAEPIVAEPNLDSEFDDVEVLDGADAEDVSLAEDLEAVDAEPAEVSPSASLLAAMKPTAPDAEKSGEKKKKKDDLKIDRNGDLEAQWMQIKEKNKALKAMPYKMSESFEARTPILHKVLGWGFIISNQNDRLEVLFQQGIKFLISNYKT